MKTTTKLLAVIMALVTLVSSMSIMAGAISESSSADELLEYYEERIAAISAKEEVIKVNNVYKSRDVADYSSLEGEDLEATKAEDEELGIYTGEWYESEWYAYFYCDKYEDFYTDGKSEFVNFFSIESDIERYGLKFKSAKYSKAQNGDVTLTFVYLEELSTLTYTVVINSKGYLNSYKCKNVGSFEEESVEGNSYTIKYESTDAYTFEYNKVDAEAIEIPEKTIVLGKDETYTLDVTVKPDNATFKDFYIDCEYMDWEVADWYIDENDNYVICAVGPGETTFNICTYSGDVVETVEIIVEYRLLDEIIGFFEGIIKEIASIFDKLSFDLEWLFGIFFGTGDDEERELALSELQLIRSTASFDKKGTLRITRNAGLSKSSGSGFYAVTTTGEKVTFTVTSGTIYEGRKDAYIIYPSQNTSDVRGVISYTLSNGKKVEYNVVLELREEKPEIDIVAELEAIRGTVSVKDDTVTIKVVPGKTMTGIYTTTTSGAKVEIKDANGTFADRKDAYVAYSANNTKNVEGIMVVKFADGTVYEYKVIFDLGL